jgi:hypothetical protein
MDIALEIHICDQRRSYTARFATQDQAIDFIKSRSSTHAFFELQDEPINESEVKLLDLLYPTCEHGLDQSNCYGPQHYYFDEEEQARGMLNRW